ncbi:MAG: choice-of-anchor Q domain-containing protein, partial [Verrucomicrobiota bacterium]
GNREHASMELYRTVIRGNRAGESGRGLLGGVAGGIFSRGSLYIEHCVIEDNRAGHGGPATDIASGGQGGWCGGIFQQIFQHIGGDFGMRSSVVRNNRAGDGGSGILEGRAGAFGGCSVFADSIVIEDCTISGNESGVGGLGGIFVFIDRGTGLFMGGRGEQRVVNTTISGNISHDPDSFGGGVFIGGTGTLVNCTIADNTTQTAGGGLYIHETSTVVHLENTLIADNTVVGGGPGTDVHGSMASLRYSLIDSTNGWMVTGTATGSLIGVNPLLAPLADNGGPTWTHALNPGSPAIDNGDPGFLPPPFTDQRGISPRVEGGRIDMGAFESDDGNEDNDSDGLPDGWELVHGFDPNNGAGPDGGAGNPDNDTMNNCGEYIAGTDPNDPASFFLLHGLTPNHPFRIDFGPSRTDRVYTLQMTEDLMLGPWTNVLIDVPGNGMARDALTFTNAMPPRPYFRLEVELP